MVLHVVDPRKGKKRKEKYYDGIKTRGLDLIGGMFYTRYYAFQSFIERNNAIPMEAILKKIRNGCYFQVRF